MRKVLVLGLLLLVAAAAYWVLNSNVREIPSVPSTQDPSISGVPVQPGAGDTSGSGSVNDSGVGRTTVTNAGSDAAELAAARAGEIRGQVLNQEGAPLAEATVLFMRRTAATPFMLGFDLSAPVDAVLTTDREGWYRVRGLASGESWDLWAWHPKFSFGEGGAVQGFSGADQVLPPITLGLGFVLEVTVLDVGGDPVADAHVELTLDGLPEALDRAQPDPLGRRFDANSDEDGFAGFEGLGAGAWVLRVRKSGYGDGWLRPLVVMTGKDPAPVTVRLSPEFPLRGIVVSTQGPPVAGARVRVATEPEGVGPSFSVLTTSTGEFSVAGLPEGRFQVNVECAGYFASRPEMIEGTEARELRVELLPIGAVHGRLILASGEPVREGRIEIWQTSRGQPPFHPMDLVHEVRTPDGSFQLDLPGGGSYVLLARAQGCASTWSAVIQARTDAVELGEWRLGAGGTLRGRLLCGADAKPLDQALIRLRMRGWEPQTEMLPFAVLGIGTSEVPPTRTRSAADGSFRIDHLPVGPYSISIEHPDAVTTVVPIEILEGGDQNQGIISLEATSGLIVHALMANGSPLAGGTLSIGRNENGFAQESRLLDANGRVTVTGMPSGDYWLSVMEGGGLFGRASEPRKVWLGPGKIEEVEIRLN